MHIMITDGIFYNMTSQYYSHDTLYKVENYLNQTKLLINVRINIVQSCFIYIQQFHIIIV